MWSDYPKLDRQMVVRHEPGERSYHVHALPRVEQPAWVARNVRHDVPRVAVKELAR